MVVKSTEKKTASSLIDLLGGGNKSKTGKTTDAFAQLLASLSTPLKGEKAFGVVVDPKIQPKTLKINEVVTLNTKIIEDPLIAEETKMLPKEMVSVLSNDQVRTLIQKAKEFLKSEITAKAPEYQIDVKALPKTLMGLVEMANKIGIDMSSITLSTLDDSTQTLSKDVPASLLSKNLFELKESPKAQPLAAPKTVDVITQLLAQTKAVKVQDKPIKESEKAASQPLQSLLKGLDTAANPVVSKAQPVSVQAQPVSVPAQPVSVPAQPVSVPAQPVSVQAQPVSVPAQPVSVPAQPVSVQAQPVSVPAQPVSVPAQPVSVPAQPVSVPAQPVSVPAQPVSVPAQPVSVPAQPVSVPAQPVSVQAQPVSLIAEEAVFKEIPKTATFTATNVLATVLRSNDDVEKSEKSKEKSPSLEESPKFLQVRTEGSIEVKSKEAVQSLSHFATNLKEAAENYKPPFTRITMKLNPEKLGEVEVTLVQRGNNIHVNIQSANASSVTFLAQNAMELRTQLAQQGVSNATMNFMSGGENQSQNPNPQQQQNRFQAYKSLSDLESNGEQLSALEIILPHYA